MRGGETEKMRKLAWLALIIFIVIVVVATLGAVNYAGIGVAIGGFMQNTFILPIRNFFVNVWNTIGTSGWYIVLATLGISLIGAVFWVPIAYNLLWKKGFMEKVLHKTPAPNYDYNMQHEPAEPERVPPQPVPTASAPINKEKEQTA